MNNPVAIELDTDLVTAGIQAPPATLSQGASDTVTVNAVTTPAGSYTYQWYRDGTEIAGETGASLTVVATAETQGVHNYAVLVDAGTSISSETFTMQIVP